MKMFHLLSILSISFVPGVQAKSAETVDGVRTVALSSAHPGESATGIDFSSFFARPKINGRGRVAFEASLFDARDNGQTVAGIFSEGGGQGLKPVLREGEIAPGFETAIVFDDIFGPLALNDAGQLAFAIKVAHAGTTGAGQLAFYRAEPNGSLTLMARQGGGVTTSGRSLALQSFLIPGLFNNQGRLAIDSSYVGPGTGSRPFDGVSIVTLPEVIVPATVSGDSVHGVSSEVTLGGIFGSLVFNNLGDLAFSAFLVRGDVTNFDSDAILRRRAGGELAAIARQGQPAPGVGNDIVFDSLRSTEIVMNCLGAIAFTAPIAGRTGTFKSSAVFSDSSGSLSLIVRQAEQVPGAREGVVFGGLGPAMLDDRGRTAFVARLSGPGIHSPLHEAIFRDGADGLSLLFQTGDVAPGTGGMARFMYFVDHTSMNSSGQLAFGAVLEGDGIDQTNDLGVFAESANGDLHLIAREGELLNVSDDPLTPDFRTIQSIDFERYPSNQLGRTSGFNNLGQLVFVATFTDGTSGVFVSNAVAVSEPSTNVIVPAAIAIVGFFRRQLRRGHF